MTNFSSSQAKLVSQAKLFAVKVGSLKFGLKINADAI